MDGLHDENTLDYIFLRRGDPTRYAEMYKLPPTGTDRYIDVASIALPKASGAPGLAYFPNGA